MFYRWFYICLPYVLLEWNKVFRLLFSELKIITHWPATQIYTYNLPDRIQQVQQEYSRNWNFSIPSSKFWVSTSELSYASSIDLLICKRGFQAPAALCNQAPAALRNHCITKHLTGRAIHRIILHIKFTVWNVWLKTEI